jgi:hypothetical protein
MSVFSSISSGKFGGDECVSPRQVNLKISVMNERKGGKVAGDSYFYCIVSPLEEVEQQHSWEQVATEMYGGNAAQHVAMGR